MTTMPRVAQQLAVIAVMSFGFSYASHGGEPSAAVQLTDEAKFALTSIDGVPSQAQLEALIPDTFDALKELATNQKGTGELQPVQLRLRAIRALSMWPRSADAQQALKQVLLANRDLTAGTNVLLAQAALEGLGRQAIVSSEGGTEVVEIVSLSLNHQSREIRIAAARSLRQMNANTQTAINALYARSQAERVESVRAAIIEAIQALTGASSSSD